MDPSQFSAGANQSIVVYVSDDTGTEIDPTRLYGQIADDAAERAQSGARIISMAAVPIRHSGVMFGVQGSGYETKVAIAVVYATS